MFEGGQQEFECEIGLFRKLPGTQLYASIVTPEVELDLGEEVQLRSIVRAGDGNAHLIRVTCILYIMTQRQTPKWSLLSCH